MRLAQARGSKDPETQTFHNFQKYINNQQMAL